MKDSMKDEEKQRKADELLESEYDGIREYDNDLPQWWRALFYITIIAGVVYAFVMHTISGATQQQQFAMQLEQEKKSASQAQAAPDTAGTNQQLLALVRDPVIITKGHDVFSIKCSPCHGAQGQGVIGPNLTDDYWIHGGSITEIKTVIENGVLEKGMLAWKSMIPPDELNAVVAFVYSIRGSNPPQAKAPEGVRVPG